ncbi:MAG: hypothetical protein ACLP7J_09220, partial [Streptosporangiaceae bacterium]
MSFSGETPENYLERLARPRPDGRPAGSGMPLDVAVRMWPTPVASDAGTDRGSSAGWGLRNAVGGLLNPTWVEW